MITLAETTLQDFAERIADDLALLRDVQMPGFTLGSKAELIEALGDLEDIDGAGSDGAEPGSRSQAANIILLSGLAVECPYQASFSKHYRQQLLACF